MWIRRHEYEMLRERAVKNDILLDAAKERILGYQRTISDIRFVANARIKELEAALLKANDDVHSTRKEVANRPPQPVNLAALFDDEDEELVAQDRRRAEAEGTTDGLLASMDE